MRVTLKLGRLADAPLAGRGWGGIKLPDEAVT